MAAWADGIRRFFPMFRKLNRWHLWHQGRKERRSEGEGLFCIWNRRSHAGRSGYRCGSDRHPEWLPQAHRYSCHACREECNIGKTGDIIFRRSAGDGKCSQRDRKITYCTPEQTVGWKFIFWMWDRDWVSWYSPMDRPWFMAVVIRVLPVLLFLICKSRILPQLTIWSHPIMTEFFYFHRRCGKHQWKSHVWIRHWPLLRCTGSGTSRFCHSYQLEFSPGNRSRICSDQLRKG